MRCILFLSAFLAFAAILPAEEARPIIYPEDLSKDLMKQSAYAPNHVPSQQEFMEVSAPAYPGLKLDLPSLKNRIVVAKRNHAYPTHDPKYYQNGGMILAYWGFPMVTGEIFSTAIPYSTK